MVFSRKLPGLHCSILGAAITSLSICVVNAGAARTSVVVRGIQYLTAESTLLPIVRQNDLVNGLGAADEASALIKLRAMVDITEAADGKSLEVGVLSGDSALDELVTNALADSGARMAADESEVSSETIGRELKEQQDVLNERGMEMRRLMNEKGIFDLGLALEQGAGEVLETSPDEAVTAEWNAHLAKRRADEAEMRKEILEERSQSEEKTATKKQPDGEPEADLEEAITEQPVDDPEYLRAKRAWNQQLAVLNHIVFKQIEARVRESEHQAAYPPEIRMVSVPLTAARELNSPRRVLAAPASPATGIKVLNAPWRILNPVGLAALLLGLLLVLMVGFEVRRRCRRV